MARQTIGEFLQTLRKANGYTQQEVADRLGISNKTLSAWETDRTYPDLLSIPALAELYGVTADEILRGERISPDGRQENDGEKISDKCERAALQNKFLKFNTQSYALLTPSCAAAVLIFFAMFPAFNFGIVLLVLGIVALLTAVILQTVFYKNALIGAGVTDGDPLTAAQEEFVSKIKATLFRCMKIDGIVYTTAGAVMFFISLVSAGGGSAVAFSAFYYTTSAVTVTLGIAALIAAERNKDNKPSGIYTEEQEIIACGNRKLLTKCIIGAVIPCVIITAAAFLFLFNTFYKTEPLCSGTKNQVKTHLQTLIVEWDSELHDACGVDPAGYYFDLPSAESVTAYDHFDLGYGFSAYYNPSSEAFVIYYTEEGTGYEILSSYAYRIMIGDTAAYNVRYCATAETDSAIGEYNGYFYYYLPEYSVELTDDVNDIYTLKEKTELYIYDGFVCWLWLGLSAAAIGIPALIYLVRRKKVD